MGARSVLPPDMQKGVRPKAFPAKPGKVYRRAGPISPVERNLVTQFVADQVNDRLQLQL